MVQDESLISFNLRVYIHTLIKNKNKISMYVCMVYKYI